MSLSVGIVGLPNVGKSTLFNALTRKKVPAENYPFCTIDPSVGIVPVPDPRLEVLTKLSHSAKTIPAVIEFVDIAGLVQGASEGEGLGNKFLSHIREVDAIAHVVRIFEDADITHVHGRIVPVHDIEVINTELILSDLATVERRKTSLEKDVRAGIKEAKELSRVIEKILPVLEEGRLAQSAELTEEETQTARQLHLISMKPLLYVLNKKSDTDIDGDRLKPLFAYLKARNAIWAVVNAGVEGEIADLEDHEKGGFREELGEKEDGTRELIQKGYKLLKLETFLTTGPDETRAWTIQQGSTAPTAAAAIHTDFRDKFIRAKVITYDELVRAGSWGVARERGKVRTEGKEYLVQDGDVVEFLI